MSKILKPIIGLVNTIVKVKTHIITKKNILPKINSRLICRYSQNYSVLSVALQKDFLQWVAKEANLSDRYLYTLKNL